MLGKTVSAPDAQLKQDIQLLCGQYAQYNSFDPELFSKFAANKLSVSLLYEEEAAITWNPA